MKIKYFLLCLCVLFVSCGNKLNISFEHNSKNPADAPLLYWVNNDTGADIEKINYSLNGSYFYSAPLPASGDCICLDDFAKKDGSRFNYFTTKPVKLKASCPLGSYEVAVDDIPINTGIVVVDDYTSQNNELLSWFNDISFNAVTSDGAVVSVGVAMGYKKNELSTETEILRQKAVVAVSLQKIISSKTRADLSPRNEDALCIELRNNINDLLSGARVRQVRFTQLDFQ